MLEHAEVFGNLYGPFGSVDRVVENGKDVLFDVGRAVNDQNSTLGKHVLSVFFATLYSRAERRLVSRQQDAREVIEKRMASRVMKSAIGPNMIMFWSMTILISRKKS